MEESDVLIRKYWLPIVLLLILAPMAVTVPHVILDSENPTGSVEAPADLEMNSDGFLLIILDGVGENIMLDWDLMPGINARRDVSSIVNLRTGPLTLSATCVSELMTGVPNSPIDGLRNFDLEHPGGVDPWILAANSDAYDVGMVGSYVLGNMYDGKNGIEFIDTFQGHADYYEGDEETLEVLDGWLTSNEHNVITAHFSGPDKVGHRWGTSGPEYEEKIRHIDAMVSSLLKKVPQSWTIVVTADHGMTEIGSHGSAEDITRDVSAFISGPDIVENSISNGHQRDMPALMSTVLRLPFPIQLHGQVPIEILDISAENQDLVEEWNWEAAYHRQVFVNEQNGIDSNGMQLEEIDWTKISEQEAFSRDVDIAISIANWVLIILLSAMAVGLKIKSDSNDQKLMLLYSGLIVGFVVSHATLSHSAMIPRALGAACAVWLVAWSFSGNFQTTSRETKLPDSIMRILDILRFTFGSFWGWSILVILLYLIFGTLTQAMVCGCLIWAAAWSWGSGAGLIENTPGKWPTYAPWLLAFAAFTFGSIRLWFALIPFLFIVARYVIVLLRQDVRKPERVPIITLLVLLFAAVTLVHRRIFGVHVMLELVKIGWGSQLSSIFFSASLLSASAFISMACFNGRLEIRKSVYFTIWLLACFVVTGLALTGLDRIFLGLILLLYLTSIWGWIDESNERIPSELILVAITAHMLVTWGVWASVVTLLLLSSIGYFWELIRDQINLRAISIQNPKPAIALAVLPWMTWILWWTLLGQVNGIQTCFEGICPHPRELDPGSIIVKGGYFGARENPTTLWMSLMVASPLVIASSLLLYELKKRGLSLNPYIISQTLLILGCINVLAFSPQYPRLIFGLTWNIFFALVQISFAALATFVFYMKNQSFSKS